MDEINVCVEELQAFNSTTEEQTLFSERVGFKTGTNVKLEFSFKSSLGLSQAGSQGDCRSIVMRMAVYAANSTELTLPVSPHHFFFNVRNRDNLFACTVHLELFLHTQTMALLQTIGCSLFNG